ncbi:hypothetical protein JSQ81_17520 [Sporosarcina sp. Marseille-Q4063]|uniref:hypothetical protein n=1 Tax=Sporosarcina sp. Marseille-Q4063 TaxID=2810514 RepID=UPI001BAEA8BB|nr:hypothetical protein [Sporosarcina sp. Marseille-Q4063]QUW21572.1 hypothetical protein JSQ81_17520 [Sporosarcina sp. Marseille-Q4063]
MCNKSKPIYILLAIFLLLLLTGCQKEENSFDILIFSTLPDEALEEMKGLAKSEIPTKLEFKVSQYPPVNERLIVEIVSHAGDILIMDREFLASVYDAKELYDLTEFRNEENTIELTSFELEALLADGEVTEEADVYDNALKVSNLNTYYNESEPIELVAIIPKYIDDKDVAFSVIKKLVEE